MPQCLIVLKKALRLIFFRRTLNQKQIKVYNLAIYFYALAARIVALFDKKASLLINGQKNTFRLLKENIEPNGRYVWFHVASLGEFEQGRPLMERLRRFHPEYKILLTFFSPSGYEVRKNYDGADIVCYLPFDTPGNVKRFLNLVNPEIAVFIKYEFWENYLTALHKRGVPTYSVSSIFRSTQYFFKWYGSAHVLKLFTHLFVQNEESKNLLASQGITNVTVVGDTRFDRVLDIRRQAADLALVEAFKDGKKTFIAGSSWQPDHEIYIPYFNRHRDWKLVIAPHVIDDEHIKQICDCLGDRKIVRYTQADISTVKDAEVLIVDCYGKLSSIYRYGEIALVGGGFGAGIHNVPEAAVYGIPVFIGPNNKKFREAQYLLKCGGAFEFNDYREFSAKMGRLLADGAFLEASGRKAGEYISGNAGAADKCFDAIFNGKTDTATVCS